MSLSFWEVSLSCPCSFPQDPKSLIEPWPEACGQTICCRLSHVLSLWGLQKSPHLALCPQQTHVDLCLLWSFLPMQTVCMSQRTFSAATSSATGMLSLLLGLSWACFPIALSASWSPGTPASLIHVADQPCPAHSWDATQTFLILGLSQPKTHLLNQPFFFPKLEPLWSRLKMCPHCKWLLFPITYVSPSHHAICSLHAGLQELFTPNHWQPLSKLKPSA